MPRYVAFLRAVNVAPRWLKMAGMRSALEQRGYEQVETHIQSGNLHLSTPSRSTAKVARELSETIGDIAGFEVPVIVLTPRNLTALVAEVDALKPLLPNGKRYLALCSTPPPPAAAEALLAWDVAGERAAVVAGHVVVDLTKDFHTTRLTGARVERLTGSVATWRDYKVLRDVATKWGG